MRSIIDGLFKEVNVQPGDLVRWIVRNVSYENDIGIVISSERAGARVYWTRLGKIGSAFSNSHIEKIRP